MQIEDMNQDELAEPGQDAVESTVTPGELLMAERQRRGFDEKYIADRLHITMHYVRVIEANRFDKLPGAVFAKGYIKSYALLLGMDPQPITDLFDAINSEQQGIKDEVSRRQVARRRSDRNKPWVYASIATFVVGMVVVWAINHDFSAADPVPAGGTVTSPVPAPAVIASQPVAQTPAVAQSNVTLSAAPAPDLPDLTPVATGTATPASDDAATAAPKPDLLTALAALSQQPARVDADAPAVLPTGVTDATPGAETGRVIAIAGEGNDVLRISFSGESWIEVNDSEAHQLYRDIREAGDVLQITGSAPFSILVGDAPYTKMTLNGAEIDVSDNIRIDNSARLTVGL